MTKKIVLIDGNPKSSSYCQHLADLYECEAREYFDVTRFNLASMAFNPSLNCGYDGEQSLEECLIQFQQSILAADHLVIVMPIWWGGIPAKLKGLFDRAFLPGFAFKYEHDNPFPVQLLRGKTSRLIITMDAPAEYTAEQAAPAIGQLDTFTLQFCGIKKAEVTLVDSIISASAENKSQWEIIVRDIGSRGQ